MKIIFYLRTLVILVVCGYSVSTFIQTQLSWPVTWSPNTISTVSNILAVVVLYIAWSISDRLEATILAQEESVPEESI